ncbi:PD-(D/E)XK nuclease-like domain-containing protein [Fibrella sp. HMF5335]|uniref:PD-(D/E)XK nuclease-like domain-containing protein n=1 Tax=Fibrella rubiginis TaxID=2817060 RepID=A0A939K5G7_9BACT|nr:PD-(D/E)XK nuclease-like domain-containing protein [Fibrella rubiginis]MBO0936445.1 PD-(D/E)XK nuclease-like domain-containing protein [Fibrella rubiginis]
MDYRQLPRIANSDLTELKNHLFGLPQRKHSPAQVFGTRFHDLLLEDAGAVPTGKGAAATKRMLDVMRANPFFNHIIADAQIETAQYWDDELTGLPCKARLDIRHPAQGLVVDVKTTSARSQREFEESCYQYEYDRQAAFYLDGCQLTGACANRFILLGIQKQKPHNLYVVEVLADSIFIDNGRRKYRRLLRSWQEVGFKPSSWVA